MASVISAKLVGGQGPVDLLLHPGHQDLAELTEQPTASGRGQRPLSIWWRRCSPMASHRASTPSPVEATVSTMGGRQLARAR